MKTNQEKVAGFQGMSWVLYPIVRREDPYKLPWHDVVRNERYSPAMSTSNIQWEDKTRRVPEDVRLLESQGLRRKRRDINEMVEPILVRVLDQLMTWRWTGVNKRHSDASQQTIRLRSRMKVLLIRRKNQRVSVSYVRMLFVVSQENSVFTLYLFKYGGFFMSTYSGHRNTPTLCRAGVVLI